LTTTTMEAVVQHSLEPGHVELRETGAPEPGRGEVLLRVGAVGVCGSDVHQYLGSQSWPVDVPVTLGHEFCGTVAALGEGVGGFSEGDRVVSETAARICGRCALCRSGDYNLCPERKGFGYGVDGAMAGYVAVPARCLHRIPDRLPFEVAAMSEPCCVAYNAVAERADVKPGDSVLVLGPGPIGLLCLLVARLNGATTTVVAGLAQDHERLSLARELGATRTVDLQAEGIEGAVAETGDGLGFDVVVDAAGASASFGTAVEAVRPLGQIVKVGWGPKPLGFSLDPIVQKAVTVRGSFSHNWGTWEKVVALLSAGDLDPRPLVGMRSPLSGWKEAFEGMHEGRFAKAVLSP